jgi:hypothetical protein
MTIRAHQAVYIYIYILIRIVWYVCDDNSASSGGGDG